MAKNRRRFRAIAPGGEWLYLGVRERLSCDPVTVVGRQPGGLSVGDGLVFDDSSFPFVRVTLRAGETTLEDIELIFKRYDAVFARADKHVLIVDTTRLTVVPAAPVRQRIKEFEDKARAFAAAKNHGSAIVMSSAIVRGAMTALRWISPAPAPNAYFATVPEAATWCVSLLQKAGVAVPSRLAELAAAVPAGTRST